MQQGALWYLVPCTHQVCIAEHVLLTAAYKELSSIIVESYNTRSQVITFIRQVVGVLAYHNLARRGGSKEGRTMGCAVVLLFRSVSHLYV